MCKELEAELIRGREAAEDLSKHLENMGQAERCPAQIEQIQYLCRMHVKMYKVGTAQITKSLILFNEIELVPYKEPEDANA